MLQHKDILYLNSADVRLTITIHPGKNSNTCGIKLFHCIFSCKLQVLVILNGKSSIIRMGSKVNNSQLIVRRLTLFQNHSLTLSKWTF